MNTAWKRNFGVPDFTAHSKRSRHITFPELIKKQASHEQDWNNDELDLTGVPEDSVESFKECYATFQNLKICWLLENTM